MSLNFKLPLKTADLPAISPFVKNRINYRVITASLLILAAIPLMLASCSKELPTSTNSSTIPSSTTPSSATTTDTHTSPSPIRIFPEYSAKAKPKAQVATYTRPVEASSNKSTHYTMDSVEYYQKNHYFADERITMDDKVARWIKHPPLRSNPGYYKRYKKVKADFYKARKYRRKLESLEEKHIGRNSRKLILADIETKKKKYYEVEARLFYQLEKIVYFAEQSYYQWQVFKNYDPRQLTQFERYSIHRSEQTANMFQDLSYAVNHYTSSDR